jgi:uncharacterized protein (TIGR02646 family)
MKFIHKSGPPHAYSAWCKKVAGTQKADYRELSKQMKGEVLLGLLAEQGWICAYTMKRLEEDNSHIEHIKPQTRCRQDKPGSDLCYENLVACFPEEGMGRKYRYGAQEKLGWWENDGKNFISPLHSNCETRFHFDMSGNITWVNNCSAAESTVKLLRLDHPALTEDRGRVIAEFLFGENRNDPLSKAKALAAIKLVCQRNANGRFYEFCIAIRDALVEQVYQMQKLAKARRFARRKKNERKNKRA